MRLLDDKERLAMILVISCGGEIDANAPETEQFSGDRGNKTDTWNLLFDRGFLEQIMTSDDEAVIRIYKH